MPENDGIYVDSSKLPQPKNEYVCWIDLMGTSSIMSQSIERATNFILRLHATVLKHKTIDHYIYPMLDGLYVTCKKKEQILELLKNVFLSLAEEFSTTDKCQHRFIPKASLAYGPVIHGRQISDKVNADIASHTGIKDSILLGLPVIEANMGEKHAPPFGVYVDISARSFSPSNIKPIPHVWWRWFNKSDKIRKTMTDQISGYYDWVDNNKFNQTYPQERISVHRDMAKEYFH